MLKKKINVQNNYLSSTKIHETIVLEILKKDTGEGLFSD
jgi:hypothetical protein